MNCCDIDPLISQLTEQGVRIKHNDGKAVVILPWHPSKIPEPVKLLLIQYREKQANLHPTIPRIPTIKKPVLPEPVAVAGQVISLHKMQATCQTTGHCLGLMTDCNLYPVRLGWCRERVGQRSQSRG